MESAVFRIPSGHGSVFAPVNIIFALGFLNLYFSVVSECDRTGPNRPCGSIANGRSIMFWLSKLPITKSLLIEIDLQILHSSNQLFFLT